MRTRLAPFLAVVATVALVIAAVAEGAPTEGGYHGVVNGSVTNPCGGNEGEGFFRLEGGEVVPLGSDTYCGSPVAFAKIVSPSDFECNAVNAQLKPASISVHAGAFDYSGKAPIGPTGSNRKVRFKGSWASDTKVKGSTKIHGGGCSDTSKWTMHLLPQ